MDTDIQIITVEELAKQLNLLLKNKPECKDYQIVVASECGYSGANLAKFTNNNKNIGIDYSNKEIKLFTDDDEFNRYRQYELF